MSEEDGYYDDEDEYYSDEFEDEEEPFLTVVKEKEDGAIEVVQSIYLETVGYDDYEPQVSPLSEMPTDELKTMLEETEEMIKEIKRELRGRRGDL